MFRRGNGLDGGPSLALDDLMIYLTQLIYLHAGGESAFLQFEDVVLPLLAQYRGELLVRLRPEGSSQIGGSAELPYELHVVRFESEADLVAYSNSPERRRWLHLKEQSVRTAVLIKGAIANPA